MSNKTFNIIITGVGGQGVITLLALIGRAAVEEGYDVRSSELHGLSQRGGAVEAHIRFGKKVYSPLVEKGKADLVISLETAEALRALSQAGGQTQFLVNDNFMPFEGSPKKEEIENSLKTLKDNLHLVPASKICQEKLQNEVVSGIYLLGYAVSKNLIPVKKESFLQAIKNSIPKKYQELNIKALQLND